MAHYLWEKQPLSTFLAALWQRITPGTTGRSGSGLTLAAAVLGFFVITLDAVVVNVALPSMRREVGGGIAGLQWVVDGYTLMFAAVLLSAGALTDRIGARRAFAAGLVVFVAAAGSVTTGRPASARPCTAVALALERDLASAAFAAMPRRRGRHAVGGDVWPLDEPIVEHPIAG